MRWKRFSLSLENFHTNHFMFLQWLGVERSPTMTTRAFFFPPVRSIWSYSFSRERLRLYGLRNLNKNRFVWVLTRSHLSQLCYDWLMLVVLFGKFFFERLHIYIHNVLDSFFCFLDFLLFYSFLFFLWNLWLYCWVSCTFSFAISSSRQTSFLIQVTWNRTSTKRLHIFLQKSSWIVFPKRAHRKRRESARTLLEISCTCSERGFRFALLLSYFLFN